MLSECPNRDGGMETPPFLKLKPREMCTCKTNNQGETVTISRKSYDELINIKVGRDQSVGELEDEIESIKDKKVIWVHRFGHYLHDFIDVKTDDEAIRKTITAIKNEYKSSNDQLIEANDKAIKTLMRRNIVQRIFNIPLKTKTNGH